ncbi:MAG TPA: tRNA lysidine(34) synthetase TilS [Candidatus Copromorpha excrementigallinarum]|uniref:tRNA(Ile)-lysidine synthase n=1 Tax=Candidatus Allocopromorpha excrementigallinarum TaxID=2840742 RepID=A0A9D1I0W2_9FIRM|nr:tRNA lysidine(34) synthetase TilS [Candidatus Copromorpha excrementigallinarum]
MVIEKVRETIKKHNLIEKNQHIVIGLSGGPDSVCLFHVLLSLRQELGLTLHPVHVNHKLRPGEAERDQAYVERLCRERGVECAVYTADCLKMAEELSMTSEEAGRKARYDAFFETAVKTGDSESVKIAVAHNADDQAETILFRLIRGTGTDGLRGMDYRRKERGFDVIRPLLDVGREEIEGYCRYYRLDPVMDHTNSEAIYARNKIRLELIPLLQREYNANIKEGLIRLGKIAAADREYMWEEAEKAYMSLKRGGDGKGSPVILDREGLGELPEALRRRVMIKALEEAGLAEDITWERLTAADKVIEKSRGTRTVEFPHGYRMTAASGQVRFSSDRDKNEKERTGLTIEVTAAAEYRRKKEEKAGGGKPAREVAFDLDKLMRSRDSRGPGEKPQKLIEAIALRHREEGDYIILSSGRRKIKKLMIDMKIPSFERNAIPLVALGSEILWMLWEEKERFAEVYGIDGNTERVITVKVM